MRFLSSFSLFLAVLVLFAFHRESCADGLVTNTLNQAHFLLNPSETNMCDVVVFRDLNNQIIPRASMPTQILAKIDHYCQITLPAMDVQLVAATNFLPAVVEMPNLSPPEGSIGLGIATSESTNSLPLAAWVQALPVTSNLVSSTILRNIAYVELIDRLAQFLSLKTGILSSGDLIYGTAGNWVTNYVPVYTMELSVRYQE